MKKVLKIAVITIICVLFAIYYAHGDNATRLYDREVDASEYIIIELGSNNVLEQRFLATEDILDGFDIMFINVDTTSLGEISYELLNKEGTLLLDGEIKLEELKNGKFFKERFSQIKVEQGEQYSVRLKTNANIGIYKMKGQEKNTEMQLDGNPESGTLIMKVISHRFNLETCIVLLGFILFIAGFMRGLYRLFNE